MPPLVNSRRCLPLPLLCAALLYSQAPSPTQTVVLLPGVPVEIDLAPGSTADHRLPAGAGDFLQIDIEVISGELIATLAAPDGAALLETHSSESPCFALVGLATGAGDYHVRLQSAPRQKSRFRIEARQPHLPSPDDDRRRVAWTAYSIGRAYLLQNPAVVNKPREPVLHGIENYQNALADFQILHDRIGEAAVVSELGVAFWLLHDNASSIAHFQRALTAWHQIGRPAEERSIQSWIALAYRNAGQFEESIDILQARLASDRSAQDLEGQAQTLEVLADTYARMDNPETQIATLQEGLRVNDLRHGNASGHILDRMYWAYMALQDYNSALDTLQRRETIERAQGPLSTDVLEELGEVYGRLGDTAKALGYYREALTRPRSALYRGNNFAAIAGLYEERLDYPKALENLKSALDLYSTWADPAPAIEILISIARIQTKLGDLPAAVEYLHRAKSRLSAVTGPTRDGLWTSLAEGWLAAGEREEAHSSYAAASSDPQGLGLTEAAARFAAIARIERAFDDLSKARAHIEKALECLESARTRISVPEHRASYPSGARSYYDFYVDLLMEMHRRDPAPPYPAEALQASERGRARTLLETLIETRGDIRHGVDPHLLQQERDTQLRLNSRAAALRQLLSREHTAQEVDSVESQIRGLKAGLDRIEAQIRANSPAYASLTQPVPLSYREIQQLVDPGVVLLEYSLGDLHSYLWAVTNDSISAFTLPPRAAIESATRLVHDLLNARGIHGNGETVEQRRLRITRADQAWPGAAAALARMVLGPAQATLAGRRLAIVADGALAYIPFGALPDPQSSRPLAAGHEIVALPSAGVLAQVRRTLSDRKPAPKTVAILADPVFDPADERVTGAASPPAGAQTRGLERSLTDVGLVESGGRIPRLPFSRTEAQSIFSLAPAGSALMAVDFDASRSTGLSASLSQYRIVHIATHSLLDSNTPALSGIVLSLVDRKGNPQNGFLRLNEIYNLNLPADLVVLSACQTALGKDIQGEGIFGLTRGFMYAGASRVIASLWKVDDAATARFMTHFYQAMLKEHLPAAAALRKAQDWVRAQPQWQSPYYWAAFELQGDWK